MAVVDKHHSVILVELDAIIPPAVVAAVVLVQMALLVLQQMVAPEERVFHRL